MNDFSGFEMAWPVQFVPLAHSRWRVLWLAAVVIATLSMAWTPVHASCTGPDWPAHIDDADVIFQGTVESHLAIPFMIKSTSFKVARVWKGPIVSRYRMQEVPFIDFLIWPGFSFSELDLEDLGEELVVFGHLGPTGIYGGDGCSGTRSTKGGIDAELAALLGPGVVPESGIVDANLVPGWSLMGLMCILLLGLSWPLALRNPSALPVLKVASSSAVVAGSVAGAFLASLLDTIFTPVGPRMNGSIGDFLADVAFLSVIPGIGAAYGAFVGLLVGPFAGLYLSHRPGSHMIRDRAIAGAGLGVLIGWCILGNLLFNVVLVVSIVVTAIGGAMHGWLLRRWLPPTLVQGRGENGPPARP